MIGRDLKHAWRSLRRSPGYALVVVLSLALGLGLTTTMFSMLDAIRHPYVPYREPEQLWGIYFVYDPHLPAAPFDVYRAVRDEAPSFRSILPVSSGQRTLEVGGEAETARVTAMPARAFSVVGVKPQLGRLLTDADANRFTVMVSHDLWRRLFPGRSSLGGASVTLDGQPYSVIGIMPRGMGFPYGTNVWLVMSDAAARTGAGLAQISGLLRLNRTVSPAAADTELAVVSRILTARYGAGRAPFYVHGGPIRNYPQDLSGIDVAMLGAAIVVLLIACANLANLTLARGFAKRREIALRLAIGAGRASVVWELFVECALLALVGAALGLFLSLWGGNLLTSRMTGYSWWLGIVEPQFSWRVFTLTFAAASGAAVLFGLAPAIRVTRSVSLSEPLKDGAGTTGRVRGRYSVLVISEIGLTLVLLMSGGLLVKAVHRLASYRFNFPAEQLLSAFVRAREDTSGTYLAFERALVGSAKAIAGVVDATVVSEKYALGGAVSAELADSNRILSMLSYPVVTPSYLRTMGLKILQGRDFADGDLVGNGAVIVNSAAAARLYPHESAVGHMLKLGGPATDAPWLPIVGVAQTAISAGPSSEGSYLWQFPGVFVVRASDVGRTLDLIIRTQRGARVGVAIARSVRSLSPELLGGVSPYLSGYEASLLAHRTLTDLFVTMASFALLLAAVGIYGVLAYAVGRRLREFAVRMALGAAETDMRRLVLHDGLIMTLAGTAVGAFAAMAAAPLLGSALVDVYPTDALTLVAAESVLVVVSVAACLSPAYRAMRADPIAILRAT